MSESVKLGVNNDSTVHFEYLICPHCHGNIDWDTFYGVVDPYDTLSTDAGVTNDYVCPKCKKRMRVCLDVLVLAEKL